MLLSQITCHPTGLSRSRRSRVLIRFTLTQPFDKLSSQILIKTSSYFHRDFFYLFSTQKFYFLTKYVWMRADILCLLKLVQSFNRTTTISLCIWISSLKNVQQQINRQRILLKASDFQLNFPIFIRTLQHSKLVCRHLGLKMVDFQTFEQFETV